ncbi:MAG: DUF2961 domain-containing protein [Planctomycetales bacterium]|nr:DUF2961 domain-containing protein [Planctomycetales bacterium]
MTRIESSIRGLFLVMLLFGAGQCCSVAEESSVSGVTGLSPGFLAGLDSLQVGETMRSSSSDIWDWKNGNSDARPIGPGETLVIADLEGPGRIQHIWNTIAAEEPGASRLVVVRMYWDGEEQPSVEAPLGDFFVIGHGTERPVQSLPVMVSSEGRARNCYWPMPFRKSAKITVSNEGKVPVQAFYYYVDWQKLPALPENTPYFHALYRQEYPTSGEKNYLLADIQGRGHYVGTVLNVRQREGGWFGEGDDFFYIDGEELPRLRGTGTEDYFCDAWGFREFNGPYYGVPIFDHYQANGRITAYRWHIADPIHFKESLRVEIEHKGAAFDESGTVRSGYEPRVDDYASVSYWYQLEPHKPFPRWLHGEERLYPEYLEHSEAEALIERAVATAGEIELQSGSQWSSGAQLFWRPFQQGESIELPIAIENSGRYSLRLALTHSWDYGIVEVWLDDKVLGSPLDLYSADIQVKKYSLACEQLEAGEHKLVFRNKGKSEKSDGYFLGVDAIVTAVEE